MRRSTPRSATLAVAALFVGVAVFGWAAEIAMAATDTEDLDGDLTATDLAQELAGVGVDVSNVRYTGPEESAGRFESEDASTYGFENGVALSTGRVDDLAGPNSEDAMTTAFGTAGDPDLTNLAGYETQDASVLEFDFIPADDTLFIKYVFASEEYNEYANSDFNDVFAFFVNGTNCAQTDDGAPVSVNTINGGNTGEEGSDSKRPDLYRDNGDDSFDTEADGMTVALTCEAAVRTGETNAIRLAIADGSDDTLDSWVLLAAEGITTENPARVIPEAVIVTGAVVGGVAAGVTTIWKHSPRGNQKRLLRKHLQLTPRQDAIGQHTSTPVREALSIRLEPRASRWEHHVSEENPP